MSTTEVVQDLIERAHGQIHQLDAKWYIRCPGSALHTHPSATKDCSVYLHADDGRFPRVVLHCVHDSCEDEVRQAQRQLNDQTESVLRSQGYTIRPLTTDERLARQEAAQREDQKKQLRLMAEKQRPDIIRQYAIGLEEFKASSPIAVPVNPQDGWCPFLQHLFAPTDVLWMGHEMQSGYPIYAANFKREETWLNTHTTAPHPFTTPSTFRPGCFSRRNENVVEGKYLVFESDTLNQTEQLAVGRYLQEKLGLDLRAAVFSGGKSIHFWFRLANHNQLEALSPLLVGLGADRKVLRHTQPVRLPGYFRADKQRWQELLWLKGA